MIGILERDHDLGVIPVGVDFALERLARAEGEGSGNDAIDFARTKRVVNERVLNGPFQTVVEQTGRSQGVGRPANRGG